MISPIQVFHFWKWEKFRSRQNNNITVNIKNHKLARDTKMIIGRLSLVFRIKTSILTRLSLFQCMRWCFVLHGLAGNPGRRILDTRRVFLEFSNLKRSEVLLSKDSLGTNHTRKYQVAPESFLIWNRRSFSSGHGPWIPWLTGRTSLVQTWLKTSESAIQITDLFCSFCNPTVKVYWCRKG